MDGNPLLFVGIDDEGVEDNPLGSFDILLLVLVLVVACDNTKVSLSSNVKRL